MVNIYERAFKEMKLDEIDHHYSDLYLKVTPVSKRLVSEYEFKNQVETFRSIRPKDAGSLWYDIPFAFPWKIFEGKDADTKVWEFSHFNQKGEHVYYNGIAIPKYRKEIVITDLSKLR